MTLATLTSRAIIQRNTELLNSLPKTASLDAEILQRAEKLFVCVEEYTEKALGDDDLLLFKASMDVGLKQRDIVNAVRARRGYDQTRD